MIFDRIFRNHSRIVTSSDLARALGLGSETKAGVQVTPERALMYSVVFACVRVLAESVGQMPLHLLRRKDRKREPAEGHPLYGLLRDGPNKHQTTQEWLEFMVASMALQGNAYSEILRVGPASRQRIAELIPLRPEDVTPKRNPDLSVTYEVARADGSREPLPADRVLHIPLFPLDGLRGVNPVHYAREAIGLGIGAEVFGARMFAHNAQPGGVLTHPGPKPLSEEAYKRIKESWEERHRGADNAHKVAILEEGMQFLELGFPAKDAQFLETRKYQRSEVAGLFRVPPHLIGDLERATFSNIEHQTLAFITHGLMPYLTRIEKRIALQLLTPAERATHYAKFNVAGLLRGDMAARATYYTQMFNVGAMSPNDIREKEDWDPREGGDVYLVPLNMAEKPEAPAPAPPPAREPEDDAE